MHFLKYDIEIRVRKIFGRKVMISGQIAAHHFTHLAPLSQHCAMFPAHVLVEVSPEGRHIVTMPALVFLDLKWVKL